MLEFLNRVQIITVHGLVALINWFLLLTHTIALRIVYFVYLFLI